MSKFKIYLKSTLIPIIVAAITGLLISKSINYNLLQKPPLAPPSIIFPIIWSILYILMGISYGILKEKELLNSKAKFIYYFQFFLNSIWPILFFILNYRFFSFIWIILLDIAVIIMIINFYKKNKLAGLLQIFYLIWIIFASYLNLAIYLLNK